MNFSCWLDLCVCVCVRVGVICVFVAALLAALPATMSDEDLQSWGWTDLCVCSASFSALLYVGQVSDKVAGI